MNKSKLKQSSKTAYDFDALCEVHPDLRPFVFENAYQTQTIDFANPKAVKALNTALLYAQGKIRYWEFPDENLCPPIPGRQAYVDKLAKLLASSGISDGAKILDIGTGATCIYPLLGHSTYNWNFVGTDIDKNALAVAQTIVDKNQFQDAISFRFQEDASQILTGILTSGDRFSASLCNPPFYRNEEEAVAANRRKLEGLGNNANRTTRNFSGTQNELIYKGGEKAFLHNYLYQSSLHKTQCFWYTSLVSKKNLLKDMQVSLKKLGVFEMKVIELRQGNKQSRVLAWTFLNKAEQKDWKEK